MSDIGLAPTACWVLHHRFSPAIFYLSRDEPSDWLDRLDGGWSSEQTLLRDDLHQFLEIIDLEVVILGSLVGIFTLVSPSNFKILSARHTYFLYHERISALTVILFEHLIFNLPRC